ncbi:MAG TPA: chromosome segregation protein SMC [Candidatus Baltobacteraceae bacterium]|jgi:chromosome segregation protein|nr:chromosome segregation protein SMC [Candidatus Baltobacteraceae bacterium]
MRLRQIKTFGFKTFAEPTTLGFGGGITAIVGPNGSGKSNLIDAFRWVLGEQSSKSLRSGKMEDVIFAGNEKRKPLGLAEVSVIFDNTDRRLPIDFTEVEITRRAYRAGEIEYYINRNQCRLRDILDLLMGTGLGPGSYSIVSQGQIDSILTSKPTDRRALFEETAGINKFLARKNESMRRLEQTEQNAIRINDLIAELGRRIPELDTQVRRAKRYRKVNARVRDLEILSYIRASASRRGERERLREQLERNEELRSAVAAKAATLGAQLAQSRTEAYQHELVAEELRTRSQDLRAELSRVEADYAAAVARREALEAQSTQTSEDAARVQHERDTLQEAVAALERRIVPLHAELEEARAAELQAQSALAQARGRLDSIFTQLRAVESAASERAARKAERRVQGENARAEAERLEQESAAARTAAEQLEIAAGAATHRYRQREQQLAHLETQAMDARARVEDAERAVTQSQSDLTQAMTAHREYSSEVAAAQSRLHTIEELENALEGHVPGTRAVVEAWQRGDLRGIEGIVSNLITTDEQYARAMDVAFGTRLSNIITRTSEDAERAIDYLSMKELGRATFLPLDTLQNRSGKELTAELRDVRGVIGYAHTLIRTEPQYEGIVKFLVGAVLVVDTLQTGIYLVRSLGLRDTVVTLSGEQIAGGGAITGGRYQRERSILSRRVQARTLREQLGGMQSRLADLESRAHEAARVSEAAIASRDRVQAALGAVEVSLAEIRTEMTTVSAEVERIDRELASARDKVADVHRRAQEARERERGYEAEAPEDARGDEERARLEAQLAQAREQIAQAEQAQAQVTTRAGDLRERHATLIAERDGAKARLGIIDQDSERASAAREQMMAEIAELTRQTDGARHRVESLRAAVGEADRKFDGARKHRESLADRVTRFEGELRSAEIEEREAQSGGESYRTRLAEIEAELGMLVSQFAQNPATDDECRDVEERYRDEPDTVADELPRLREELARLSANVNLNAEADREEIAQRETFLRAQLDDLSKARETLLQSIREIEEQTQAKFNETFEQVSAAFTQMYAKLFPGGQAKMWQTNPENLSETGIEMSVQPPGKKLMPLPTLSGGERAMTAAALIFALIKVRPSPFYLLDEVDAALDDTNVERFSNMVRELATDSQIILVTHNKQTMELADRMYGVTMAEAGVSSIISAELAAPQQREPEPAIA